ncbi:MAG: paaG 1, partial [Frankiales bacterium]|nr:paaG 1 [Frankiales bacterium]
SSLLSASVGLHRALHLALLNPMLSAAEAQASGLVPQVHPDGELYAAVSTVVSTLLSGSRSAQVAAKLLLRAQAVSNPEGALRRETLAIRASAGGPDGQEGVDAFLAKRAPTFPSSGGPGSGVPSSDG